MFIDVIRLRKIQFLMPADVSHCYWVWSLPFLSVCRPLTYDLLCFLRSGKHGKEDDHGAADEDEDDVEVDEDEDEDEDEDGNDGDSGVGADDNNGDGNGIDGGYDSGNGDDDNEYNAVSVDVGVGDSSEDITDSRHPDSNTSIGTYDMVADHCNEEEEEEAAEFARADELNVQRVGYSDGKSCFGSVLAMVTGLLRMVVMYLDIEDVTAFVCGTDQNMQQQLRTAMGEIMPLVPFIRCMQVARCGHYRKQLLAEVDRLALFLGESISIALAFSVRDWETAYLELFQIIPALFPWSVDGKQKRGNDSLCYDCGTLLFNRRSEEAQCQCDDSCNSPFARCMGLLAKLRLFEERSELCSHSGPRIKLSGKYGDGSDDGELRAEGFWVRNFGRSRSYYQALDIKRINGPLLIMLSALVTKGRSFPEVQCAWIDGGGDTDAMKKEGYRLYSPRMTKPSTYILNTNSVCQSQYNMSTEPTSISLLHDQIDNQYVPDEEYDSQIELYDIDAVRIAVNRHAMETFGASHVGPFGVIIEFDYAGLYLLPFEVRPDIVFILAPGRLGWLYSTIMLEHAKELSKVGDLW